MLSFVWDWLFDFLPWKIQVALLVGIGLLIAAAILFVLYG